MWMEEGQVTWCGWMRARSLDADGGGPGLLVWMEEGQVTWCGWKRATKDSRGGETVRLKEKGRPQLR